MTVDQEIMQLRARVADLEAALNLNNITLQSAFKLTPTMSALLGLLVSLPVVTDEIIKQRLKLAADSKVLVYRLRKALEPHEIEIFSRRGTGWYLNDDARAVLQAVTAEVTAEAA